MNLSPHFTLEELTFSDTAVRKGINNTPGDAVLENLKRIAQTLEEVRALVGGPIRVSSGYRSPELNKAIGGSGKSAHVEGLAADITVSSKTPKELAIMIRDSNIKYDQLIYEGTWVHIGLASGALRQQDLTAHFGSGPTTYSNGIV
ncbi:MAG: hypothetical protein RL748_1822 [Pseudomonadota bacterium]|jgi:hypothetical protein